MMSVIILALFLQSSNENIWEGCVQQWCFWKHLETNMTYFSTLFGSGFTFSECGAKAVKSVTERTVMREKHTEPLLGDLALFSWQAVNWRAPDWECRSGNNLVTLSCFLRRWKKLPVLLNSLALENYSWSEKLRQKCEQKISRTRSLNNQHINSKSSGWTTRESYDEPNEWSGHSYGDRIIITSFC